MSLCLKYKIVFKKLNHRTETFEKLSYKSLRGVKRRGNPLYFQ